jgi:hypothetical protein
MYPVTEELIRHCAFGALGFRAVLFYSLRVRRTNINIKSNCSKDTYPRCYPCEPPVRCLSRGRPAISLAYPRHAIKCVRCVFARGRADEGWV